MGPFLGKKTAKPGANPTDPCRDGEGCPRAGKGTLCIDFATSDQPFCGLPFPWALDFVHRFFSQDLWELGFGSFSKRAEAHPLGALLHVLLAVPNFPVMDVSLGRSLARGETCPGSHAGVGQELPWPELFPCQKKARPPP